MTNGNRIIGEMPLWRVHFVMRDGNHTDCEVEAWNADRAARIAWEDCGGYRFQPLEVWQPELLDAAPPTDEDE